MCDFGQGKDGRLGHGDVKDVPSPCSLDFFEDMEVSQGVAGNNFCLALTSSGHVFGWGKNDQVLISTSNKLRNTLCDHFITHIHLFYHFYTLFHLNCLYFYM